jgi:hypothetical protein
MVGTDTALVETDISEFPSVVCGWIFLRCDSIFKECNRAEDGRDLLYAWS